MLDKLRYANTTRQVQWENAQDKLSLSYLGNAIAGNPNFKDHWDDIAGYAKLGSEACDEAHPPLR